MQNAIEASSLTKYYDGFLAVDHISFNVEKPVSFPKRRENQNGTA